MLLEAVAAILLGVLVLWLVLQPLYGGPPRAPAFEEPEDPEETRRGIALIALKEIDFDRATGKLSEADWEALKAKYTVEALEAIREEEGAGAPDPAAAAVPGTPTAACPRCPRCGPRPEPDARFCSGCGGELVTADTCGVCRAELPADSRFCATCGSKVAA